MDHRAPGNTDAFHQIVERSPTGMLVVDTDGVILYANPAAASLLGRPVDSLPGTTFGIATVGEGKVEIDIHHSSGGRGVAELSSRELQWNGGSARLITFDDVTQRHEAMRAMRHQALHDELTGLPNRAFLERHLDEAVARAAREGGALSVLFLDLDRFKEINDSLGHSAGDDLLKVVAERLRESIRRSDVVARISGDEFAAVLQGVGDPDTAYRVAEKIRAHLAAPVQLDSSPVFPSCTIGVSVFPDDGNSAETLLMHADTAMLKAKEQGRNRTFGFSMEQADETRRRFHLIQELQRAWNEGGFHLVYQPQVTLPDGSVSGTEALLRCTLPGDDETNPGEFIPLLEETGLIHEVGLWVFREAGRLFAADGAAANVPGRVWVNVSAQQLSGSDLVDSLDILIRKDGIDPARFGIELTESMIAGDVAHATKVLNALRDRGFRLAMDDFGNGYSSLTFLRQLPLDVVKVDQGFVRGYAGNSSDRKMLRAIAAMCHGLDLPVLAEGVETEEQFSALVEEGYDAAQGFLISRPIPAEALIELPERIALPPADQALARD